MKMQPLTPESFVPFGSLLRSNGSRVTYPETTAHDGVPGAHAFAVSRVMPALPGPIHLPRLELHPHTTQTFIPLTVTRWLLVAVPSNADGGPDLTKAAAFIACQEDAICFARNVWHATLTVLDTPAEIIMLMWRSRARDDTVLFNLTDPLRIEV